MDDHSRSLTILGGGPAGLAVGYYAAKARLPFTLLEAADRVGGNCATVARGPFRFDTGAHRFHDKDPLVTREIRTLMGDDLRLVAAPSHVYFRGKLVHFPLSPLDLVKKLGPRMTARAAVDFVAARAGLAGHANGDFESFAVRTYGRTLAKAFLLDYSEKLWGLPCAQLSPSVAGKRLKGLNLRTFLLETVRGRRAATRHLDGAFLYPRGGYGAIALRLADRCGAGNIRQRARVSGIFHDGETVHSIGVNGQERLSCAEVVNTLPLPLFIRLLEPRAPDSILDLAARLRFRDVTLVALFLNRPSVTRSATVYFPDPEVSFNRLYEPRNRCPEMAPAGQTSVVMEIAGDRSEAASEASAVATARETLVRMGWIREDEILDSAVQKLPCAYPVLEVGFEETVRKLVGYLAGFRNLRIVGRNGRFAYTHLHDMMRFGHDAVASHLDPTRAQG